MLRESCIVCNILTSMSFIRKYKRAGSIYLAEVENQWVKGKVVQRFIRYVGKEVDGRTVLSTSVSDAHIQEVKLYGPLLVLHHLAEKNRFAHPFRNVCPRNLKYGICPLSRLQKRQPNGELVRANRLEPDA